MAKLIPYIDASSIDCITDDHAKFFHEKGFLVVKNLISGDELKKLQDETYNLIQQRNKGSDYWFNDEIPEDWYTNYKDGASTRSDKDGSSKQSDEQKHEVKRGTPFRIEYPVDKLKSCVSLLAHPFLLRSVEKLQGLNFIPTWDSLVFKEEGDGVPIKWHRDASAESIGGRFALPQHCTSATHPPPVDVGIYLDEASVKLGNCLYVIPSSNFWPDQLAATMIAHLTESGFRTSGAIPVEVGPGDMILHNILILHGSPACKAPLRRTVYYEFRAAESELAYGPHIPSYIPAKQRVLAACIRQRVLEYPNETPYEYKISSRFATSSLGPDEQIETYRYPHEEYFSKSYRG